MQLQRILKLLLAASFTLTVLFLLSSCSHVEIKDEEVCGDMGSLGAACFNTLTPGTRDIPPEQWADERFGKLCFSSDAFADWKSAIEKLCSKTKRCTYKMKEEIRAISERVEAFQQRLM